MKPKIKSISFAFDAGQVEFHRGPHTAPEWYSNVRQPSVIRAMEWLDQRNEESAS